jgi:hypothetical protein
MSELSTKSQWAVIDVSVSGHCCFEQSIFDENGEHVCELWSEHAHLIAAAPEMYKMLERVILTLKTAEQFESAELVGAVLAKARGEE